MRERVMELLCCPVCRGELILRVERKVGDDVMEGWLLCAQCRHEYRVSDGIPDLLPPDKFKK